MRRFISRLRSNLRILIMFTAVVCITAAVGIVAILNLNKFERNLQSMYAKDLVEIK